MKFNPHLTGSEFAALTPDQQAEWNRALWNFWTGKNARDANRDYARDRADERDNDWTR